MNKLAHIMPNYGKYGISGYVCIVVGLENVFCKTLKEATRWCKKNSFDFIKL